MTGAKLLLRVNRSHQDPTNQAPTRNRATRDNNRRLNGAAKEVLKLWSKVEPKRVVKKDIVNNIDFYEYEDSDQLSLEEIQAIIDEWLETSRNKVPAKWYFSTYDEQAYRSGTIQENSWVEVITAAVVAFVLLQDSAIFLTPEYKRIVKLLKANDYRLLQNLSKTTSNQIFQVIQSGIDSGLGKRAIRRQIVKRFEVAKSSAKRIVDTEINKAYNNARLDLIDTYTARGARLGVIHISALLTTTRDNHAARHGLGYTTQQQRRWWDSNSNRINCHCRVQSAVLNSKGEIVDKDAQNQIILEGKLFFKE